MGFWELVGRMLKSEWRKLCGRAFQVVGAIKQKRLWPKVLVKTLWRYLNKNRDKKTEVNFDEMPLNMAGDGQTGRQADRQTQTDIQTDTDRSTDTETTWSRLC